MKKGELILYQTEDGLSEVSLRASDGTVWLTQLADDVANRVTANLRGSRWRCPR